MRTTIDLPDALYRQAKSVSALRGMNLKQFVTAAIERALADDAPSALLEADLPLIRTGRPGSLRLSNADIEDLLA